MTDSTFDDFTNDNDIDDQNELLIQGLSNVDNENNASAPTDYYVIDNENKQQSTNHNDEINKMLFDIESDKVLIKNDKVFAEADSSTPTVHDKPEPEKPSHKEPTKPKVVEIQKVVENKDHGSKKEKSDCTFCPYYMLVKDLLLWNDPKYTGAIFGTSFVLLLSLASFSLLTVIGSIMLLTLSAIGAYRFYLALMFRIKGTPDDTFEKLSSYDLSFPKDKVKNLTNLLETDINKAINKIKSIVLWDSVSESGIAFAGFYMLYCIGSVFNTLTLLILTLVSAFTLPKVYQIYKVPIDAFIEKATATVHLGVKQVMAKIPYFNKKTKTQ